jgi:hypothetical protein
MQTAPRDKTLNLLYMAASCILPSTWACKCYYAYPVRTYSQSHILGNVLYLDSNSDDKDAMLLSLIRYVVRHGFLYLKSAEQQYVKGIRQLQMNQSLYRLQNRQGMELFFSGWYGAGIDGQQLYFHWASFFSKIFERNSDTKHQHRKSYLWGDEAERLLLAKKKSD